MAVPEEEMTLEEARAAALASLELDAPAPSVPPPSASSAAPEPPASYDEDHPPHLPTPSLILEIDHSTIVHLLSHFTHWFTERQEVYEAAINYVPSTIFAPPALRRKAAPKSSTSSLPPTRKPHPRTPPRPPLPTSHEVHWILSLLSKLDSLLAGDEMSTLRDLAKILLQLVEESEREKEGREWKGRSKEERASDEEEAEGRAGSWMVVAAVAAGWGQSDLWNGY